MTNKPDGEQMRFLQISPAWRFIMDDCHRKMDLIQNKLSNDMMLTLEDVRFLQGEYKALKDITNQFDNN